VLVVISSTACSSDGSKQTDPYCTKLTAVSQRLISAEQDFFKGGAGGQGALSRVVGELQALQPSSPTGIRTALAELIIAFQDAEHALRHPSKEGQEQLAQAADVLSADGNKLSNYVTSKCK
jgi:hypothetical protein